MSSYRIQAYPSPKGFLLKWYHDTQTSVFCKNNELNASPRRVTLSHTEIHLQLIACANREGSGRRVSLTLPASSSRWRFMPHTMLLALGAVTDYSWHMPQFGPLTHAEPLLGSRKLPCLSEAPPAPACLERYSYFPASCQKTEAVSLGNSIHQIHLRKSSLGLMAQLQHAILACPSLNKQNRYLYFFFIKSEMGRKKSHLKI